MGFLHGNAVVAQSGGPTTVINASACGVIQEALRHGAIGAIFGANNGILGIVQEDLFDLRSEAAETIEGLRRTPSAAVGSCRYKLGDLAANRDKYQRILDVFRAHFAGHTDQFVLIGGTAAALAMEDAGLAFRAAPSLGERRCLSEHDARQRKDREGHSHEWFLSVKQWPVGFHVRR